MSGQRTVFLRRLARILAEEVNSGKFSRPGIDAEGGSCVHHFSWAVGMALLHWGAKYRKRFGWRLPDWCELCNPYHVSRLCEMALEASLRLPKTYPVRKRRGRRE